MSEPNLLQNSLHNANILVVDDTIANLEVITDTLTSDYYSVSAVTSGQRALKQLQRQIPDLILLDVQMPDMDGFETCRRIKANPATASIPLIFITALADNDSIAQGFAAGAVDYITKPFREVELLARVRTHLNLHFLTEQLEEQVQKRTAELQETLQQLKQSQLKIIQGEKMASLGNLVAGVAHEINNPIGFLNGSLSNAQDYLQDLCKHLDFYQEHQPPIAIVQDNAEDIDLEFLLGDFPKLLRSMQDANDRIKKISTSLRVFSRADTEHPICTNLHESLDSTLLILKYRLKANKFRPEIEVIKDYGDLPEIHCFPGQLNQVFMNILANAIDTFDEIAQQYSYTELKKTPQKITVTTQLLDSQQAVEIRIADNGQGISDYVKEKMFDRLFTTKEVGKGTGLGLAIAHQIITETHEGRLTVDSQLGQGSTFIMQLPFATSLNASPRKSGQPT
ncbi:MAG: response regulator [Jaaginema sp. PMC 1079.18]|nr:response regulator [Jaaginema sp. PMC 1080.18]MEC4850369.1 response regulator [Jaaginema sp. PMC 1079.18]MEC4864989.1 response regulator [Jaaginema sp. PMC 1078.18]